MHSCGSLGYALQPDRNNLADRHATNTATERWQWQRQRENVGWCAVEVGREPLSALDQPNKHHIQSIRVHMAYSGEICLDNLMLTYGTYVHTQGD